MFGKGRGGKFDRVTFIYRFHEYCITHSFVICFFGCVRFAGLGFGLASLSEFGAGVISERSVAGCIDKNVRFDLIAHFGRFLEAVYGGYSVSVGLAIVH